MASEKVFPMTSEVKMVPSVSFKKIIEIKPDNIPVSSSIDTHVSQEQSLNEESQEVNLSPTDVEVTKDDDSATVEAETEYKLIKSISTINETRDDNILTKKQSRPLTIEKFEQIENERRKQKKALKRLARQQQVELANEDQVSMDTSLVDEKFPVKASIVTYDDLLLLEAESSSTISTSSSDSEECSLMVNENFLRSFAKLPDIDEISLVKQERTSNLEIELHGKFVNPLTGETDSTTTNTDLKDTYFIEESTYTEGKETDEEDSEVELSDIVLPEEDEDVVPPVELHRYQSEMRLSRSEVNFLAHIELSSEYSKTSSTATERKEIGINSFDVVKHFIQKLINDVIDNETTKKSMENLSAKLDKSKLINELIEVWTTLVVERNYNDNIKSKMVNYYRRLHRFWAITPQPIELELMEHRRYKYLLSVLDHLREKAESTKKRVMYTIDNIILDMRTTEFYSNVTADRLEDRMRKTIAPLGSKELEKSLEADIKNMRELRNQIGETRMRLLRHNDTLARFLEQLMDFDPIDQDFSLTRYINIQQDINKLDKLLEGRANTFDHVHDRCDNYIKRVAFYREKTDIAAAILNEQKERLQELYSAREKLRDQLQKLHLQHNRCKAEQHELDLKAGIFRSQYLMLDYDKCMDLLVEKRKVVVDLRSKVQKMGNRLAKICAQAVC